MRKNQILSALALCLLFCLCLSGVSYGVEEFRAAWVTRYEWPSSNESTAKANINAIMNNLGSHGFNAVMFQIRGQMDVLYPSPYEPWSYLLGGQGVDPGWDPLAYAITAAHNNGLEFHAYINTNVCWSSSTQTPPQHTSPEHPYWNHCDINGTHDWLLCDSNGTPQTYLSDNYVWVAAGVPSFQEWTRKVTMHVVDNYDVDGIHYDRIRFPANTYSYDPISNSRRGGIGNPHSLDFKNWQRDQLTRMLTDIYGEIQDSKPGVTLSCSPFGIYDRSRFAGYSGYTDAYDRWLQEAQHWLQAGCMDAVVPMIYWNIASDPKFDLLVQDWIDYNYGRHVYAGLSGSNFTFPELGNQVTETRNRGGDGTCVFSYGAISSSEFDTFLNSYYSQSADTPSMSWKTNPSNGIIMGFVRDGSNDPVVDAWVTRTGSSYVTLSAHDGRYVILNVPPGTYTISADKTGVGSASATGVSVTAGSITTINFNLVDGTPTNTPTATPTGQTPSDIIVDNSDTGYSDETVSSSWFTSSSATDKYGADYRYNSSGTGSDTATWQASIPSTGDYDVYVWYSIGANRSTDAPYTVNYSGGSQTVDINQQANGGQWVQLGTYYFAAGSHSVVLSDNASGTNVVADAVKWTWSGTQPQGTDTPTNTSTFTPTNTPTQTPTDTPTGISTPSDIIVDDADGGYSDTGWANGTYSTDKYATSYRFDSIGTGSDTATWQATIATTGNYDVYVWYPQGTNRAVDSPYTVNYSGGSQTIDINQQSGGGQWNLIGTFYFEAGSHSVVLSDDASGGDVVLADAVRWAWDSAPSGPTNTPTNTLTNTPSNTPSNTPTDTPTDLPTDTPTDTPTDGPTDTPSDTPSNTPTDTPTATSTNTPTDTPTSAGTPTDIIIDNSDSGYSDSGPDSSWLSGSYSSDKYGTDYRFNTSGYGADTATWQFSIPTTGTYEVSVWYPQGSNRPNDSPYTVYYSGGSQTVDVNQQTGGGQWNSIGTYSFSAGSHSVVLSDDAQSGQVILADAVKVSWSTSVTLLDEDFENGYGNWSTDWETTTSYYTSYNTSAWCDQYDNNLTSSSLNFSGKSSATIQFYYRDDDIDDYDDVYLQFYNGSSWVNIFELGNSSEDTWHLYQTTIYNSGGEAQFFVSNFGLNINGTSIDRGENLFIDDVLVTAEN